MILEKETRKIEAEYGTVQYQGVPHELDCWFQVLVQGCQRKLKHLRQYNVHTR
jgi:hypothetical protein